MTMTPFWKRLIRSGFGTKVVARRVLKYLRVQKLKSAIRQRTEGPKIANREELRTLMADHPYINDAEILLFSRYASRMPRIVEIGSAFGASASIFLANSSSTTEVHSIDPFVRDSMAPFQATPYKCRKNVRQVLKACGKLDRMAQWHLHPDFSYNLAPTWHKPIDLLFIDGDHRYEAVKKDFDDWYPHVLSGGYILLHDSRREPNTPEGTFKRGWPGPTKLAKELLGSSSLRLLEEVFSITVWQKI